MSATFKVVRQTAGGSRCLGDGRWMTEAVTVATVATGLDHDGACRMVREDALTTNLRAGLPGYWLAIELESR